MNEQLSVSVIIPLYNSETYIESTILSVINQEQHNLEYEIIVVDDLSTDRSVEIVSKMPYEKIKLLELIENKGTANARNIGLKNATGDWIIFLDSDDRLSCNLFANFCTTFKSGNTCYLFGFIRENTDFNLIQTLDLAKDKRAFGLFGTVCNKIIHKSICLEFKPEYSFEDICYIIDVMNRKDVLVTIIQDSFYLYNKKNPTSKMTNFDEVEYKKMVKYVFSQIKYSDKLTRMFILEVFVGILFSKEIPFILSIPIALNALSKLFFYLPSVISSQCRFWINTKIVSVRLL